MSYVCARNYGDISNWILVCTVVQKNDLDDEVQS